MNAVQCSIDFTRLSFALKDTLRLHNFRRYSTVRATAPVLRGYARFHGNAIPEEVEPLISFSSGNGSFQLETQLLLHDLELAVNLLPEKFRASVLDHEEHRELIELVLDYGRPPLARFPTGDFPLSEAFIDFKDLDSAVKSVGEFGDDNRTGVEGTLHRVSCMRDRHDRIYGLTIRIGRAVTTETAGLVIDPLAKGLSVLLLGPPGVGKTTAIRSFCRLLSDDLRKRVVIVDTSNEIAGHGLIPHPAVGSSRRMQLKRRADQHHIMVEAVQNHMPEVIVIDEIGKREECQAAKSISQRGVQLLATTHARTLEDVIKDPVLRELVGGISNVTIGDGRASQTNSNKKTVPERANASSFNVIVEMTDRTQWRIHYDADSAVDAILAGCSTRAEIRYLDEEGKMIVTDEFQGAGVSIPQQTRGKMRKPLVKPEPTNSKTNNTNTEVNISKGNNNISNEPRFMEAARIMSASSNLEVLQTKDGASTDELKKCFSKVMRRVSKKPNEDKLVKKSRVRVQEAYNNLLRSISTTKTISVRNPRLKEAERIINASSDLEILQVKRGASNKKLSAAFKALGEKITKTKDEDKTIKKARRLAFEAYLRLLPPKKKKTDIRTKSKKKIGS